MSGAYNPQGRLLWSLSGSGLGASLSASGNSGAWDASAAEGPLSLAGVTDLALLVTVTSVVSVPSLTVGVDLFDDAGHLFSPAGLKTAAITAAGSAEVYAGLHGGSASAYLVLPEWGRVSWAISGGSCDGVEIALYGR